MNKELQLNAYRYLDAGLRLSKLGVKSTVPPKDSERDELWLKTREDVDAAVAGGHNIAWIIEDGHMVIDVDVPTKFKPEKVGHESFKKLLDMSGVELYGSVVTPSGGQHYYLRIGQNDVYHTTDKATFPDIDFLQSGRYVLIAGCETRTNEARKKIGGRYRWHDDNIVETPEPDDAPSAMLAALSYKGQRNTLSTTPSNTTASLDDFDISEADVLAFQAGERMAPNELIEKLTLFNPDCDNDFWLKIAMCVKDIHPDENGYKIFDRWCKGAYWQGGTPPPKSYNAEENRTRWNSITPKHISGKGTGLGTLLMLVKEVETKAHRADAFKMKDRILAAPSLDRLDELKRDIKRMEALAETGNAGLLDMLAEAWHVKNKALGVPVTKPNARKEIRALIAPAAKTVKLKELGEAFPMPTCLEPVYEDLRVGHFIDVTTLTRYENIGRLSRRIAHQIPDVLNGDLSFSAYLDRSGNMKACNGIVYRPDVKKRVFEEKGLTYVNEFDDSEIPRAKIREGWTHEDQAAVDYWRRHILLICNGNVEHANQLIAWLAHQVQHMGVKIRWSPFIYGTYGIGKSSIGKLLSDVLGGSPHVASISSTLLASQFTSWAEGSAVGILEELRDEEVTRTRVYTRLLSPIADDEVVIEYKGKTAYATRNTTNYLAFTNHHDAMAIPEGDRRWFVIWSGLTVKDIEESTGEVAETYFNDLNRYRENHVEALRGWLMNFPIEDYITRQRAPMTEFKKQMTVGGQMNIDGLEQVQQIMAAESPHWDKDVVNVTALNEEFRNVHGFILKGWKMARIMKELGYVQTLGKMMHKGQRVSVRYTMRVNSVSARDAVVRGLEADNNRTDVFNDLDAEDLASL